MTCFHPRKIYIRGFYPAERPTEEMLHDLNKAKFKPYPGYYELKVPCGQCIGCILDHANTWATRCAMECSCHTDNCFITLTYNNALRISKRTGGNKYKYNLPRNKDGKPTLYLKDFSNFMKRLRKKHPEIKIRFFAAGEYGPKNGRPHYHAIIFGYKPKDLKLWALNQQEQPLYVSEELEQIWGHGFVTVGEATYESACYVARYCMKKWGLAEKKIETYRKIVKENGKYRVKKCRRTIKKEVEPEFINMSRNGGIGLQKFYEDFEKIKRNSGILVRQNIKKIPKLFKKKWEEMDWEDFHKWAFENRKRGEQTWKEILDKYTYPTKDYEEKEKIYLQEQERILYKKIPKLHRDNIIQ